MSTYAKGTAEKPTVVLIHGLWLTALSWEKWVARYEAQGYRVIARSWPGMEGDIDQLRRDPVGIGQLGVTDLVDHYATIIDELDSPPIIIGHSFGGLIVQILLDRGLGSAGVAIAPAPVKGILALPFAELKSAFPALKNPFKTHEAVSLTPEQFHYSFTNDMSAEESLAAFKRYAVPGPNHVLFQASLANFNPHAATTVDFANDDRAPLLIVAGGKDHVVPAVVAKANYKLFAKSSAITEFKEYPERTHWTIGEAGWEGIADYVLEWAVAKSASFAGKQ